MSGRREVRNRGAARNPKPASERSGAREVNNPVTKSKKPNYVPLNQTGGPGCIQIPGRHSCFCEASTHSLIGNCLGCGRIVCAQEGVGDCFTCGRFVYDLQQRREMRMGTKVGRELQKLEKPDVTSSATGLKDIALSFEKAVLIKDQLLEYDQDSKQRTNVIDDESDYFRLASEHWMDPERRAEVRDAVESLHEKKRIKERKLVIDCEAREIRESREAIINDVDSVVREIEERTKLKSDYEEVSANAIDFGADLPKPEYVRVAGIGNKEKLNDRRNPYPSGLLGNLKLQDSSLTGMSDEGACLTIQQPWASLLIHGVKLHEGRTWFTGYRGRVWIHAGHRKVSGEDINRAENLFRLIDDDASNQFPSEYPEGFLLGYATLVECLPQDEYKSRFPTGYVDNLYAFIFEDPVLLKVRVPMSGKRNLFKLDEQIFKAASKQISSVKSCYRTA